MNTHYAALSALDSRLAWATDQLIALANQNSGSFNAAGVAALAEQCVAMFAPLGVSIERLAVAPFTRTTDNGLLERRPLGPAVRLRQRPEAPIQVFFCGHMDTVFAAQSAFQQCQRLGDDRLNGPGVADLKGGLVALRLALEVLEASPLRSRIGYTVLLNPDEEIGSTGSAPLLREAATQHHFGLIYEPALPDGSLASVRKGSGNFDVIIHGRAAHAGRDFAAGRNAIAAAANFTSDLFALNGQREGVTINPGYVHGGGALNVVPDTAVVKFNVRTQQSGDECWMHEALDQLMQRVQSREGYRCELRGGFTRPPKELSDGMQRLMQWVQQDAHTLGFELRFKPTGGCCDGNNLAAAGLPNLDNMGVVGDAIHSDQEWMHIPSLVDRAKLTALLLLQLAAGERTWT